MAVYSLFGVNGNGATGPSSATGYSGPYQAGVIFEVTSGGTWLEGYWWWVCNSGQQTSAVTLALWEPVSGDSFFLVPDSAVTSGALTAGQWNYVPLITPIMLSQSVAYTAVCGYESTTGFPDTAGQFGSGDPYAAGITSGPLFAYSDTSGSAGPPASQSQGLFGTGSSSGASASANYPGSGSDGSSNFWLDIQVSSTAPSGASYQLWPSQPYPLNWANDTANNFTLATEFSLSQNCTLTAIWFYSPAGTSQLPTECGIWAVASQTLVAGTDNASPSWSGAAGSGWVSCAYAGVTLQAATSYKVAVFNGAASPVVWSAETSDYWISPGPGVNGITNGALAAPGESTATSPGQSTYNQGTPFAYPGTYASGIGANYWVDVQVTPVVATPPPVLYSMRMMP